MRQRIVRSITAFSIVIAMLGMMAGVIYLFAYDPPDRLDNAVFIIGFGTSAVFYNVMSLLILARYPRHVVGWLFLTTGLLQSVMMLGTVLEIWIPDRYQSVVMKEFYMWFSSLPNDAPQRK